MQEKDLFPPLQAWLHKKGYKVYTEVPSWGYSMDVVADPPDNSSQIALEMKMSLTKHLIKQACYGQAKTGIAYVVIPTKPKEKSIQECKKQGLGIIQVVDNEIIELLKPEKVNTIIERIDFTGIEEGETAGIPAAKGQGMAQQCLIRIKHYLKTHPKAKWPEIYDNVYNHYSSYRSMASSMRDWQGFSLNDEKKQIINNQIKMEL